MLSLIDSEALGCSGSKISCIPVLSLFKNVSSSAGLKSSGKWKVEGNLLTKKLPCRELAALGIIECAGEAAWILVGFGKMELFVPFPEDEFIELRFVEGADMGLEGNCVLEDRNKSDWSLDRRVETRCSVAVELKCLSAFSGCIIPKVVKLCHRALFVAEDEFLPNEVLFGAKE